MEIWSYGTRNDYCNGNRLKCDASGEQGAPPKNGTTNGDWIIEDGDDVVREDESLSIGGDIKVMSGGSLLLVNTTLKFQENTEDPYYFSLDVDPNGSLEIEDGSRIDAPWDGQIYTAENSSCTIQFSEINDIRLIFDGSTTIQHCRMTNLTHLWCRYGSSYNIIQNTIHTKDEVPLYNWSRRAIKFWYCTQLLLDNNTIISEFGTQRFNQLYNCSDAVISFNTYIYETNATEVLILNNCINITIHHNEFQYCSNPMVFTGSHEIMIHNNSFHSNVSAGGLAHWAIWCRSSYSCEITNNIFTNFSYGVVIYKESYQCRISYNTFFLTNKVKGLGIHLEDNSYDCDISYNTLYYGGTAISVWDHSHSTNIHHNTIFKPVRGISIGGTSYSCLVQDNTIHNSTKHGIRITNWAYSIDIINNKIYNSSSIHIYIDNESHTIEIGYNEFHYSDFGIYITNNSHSVEIGYNEFYFSDFGIYITNNSHSCIISQNIILDQNIVIYMEQGYNCTFEYNTITSMIRGIDIFLSHDCVISNNTIDSENSSINIEGSSYTIAIEYNTISDSYYGVVIANRSNSIAIHHNVFSSVIWPMYFRNSRPQEEHDNVFLDIDNIYLHKTDLYLSIVDPNLRPLENCSITLTNGLNETVYNGYTDRNGNIPWMLLSNASRILNETIFFNPYLVEAEKMGVHDTVQFSLPEQGALDKRIQLPLLFDTALSIEQFPSPIERGSNLSVIVRFWNSGTVTLNSSHLQIDLLINENLISIFNKTFLQIAPEKSFLITPEWFVDRNVDPGWYTVSAELTSMSPGLEEPLVEENRVNLQIVNSPPDISRELEWDTNITVMKNEVMTLDLTPYIYDFEDDIEDLIIGISDYQMFDEVDISLKTKIITILPPQGFSGCVWVNITITDLDGSQVARLIPLQWINRDPTFLADIEYIWYSTERTYQLDLMALVFDEDMNESFAWDFSSDEFDNGYTTIELGDDFLHITREVNTITSTDITLTVFDSSNASCTQNIVVIWEADMFINNVEIIQENETSIKDDIIEIVVTINNNNGVLAKGKMLCYVDGLDNIVMYQLFEMKEKTTQKITFFWSAVSGDHELIFSIEVTSPLDRNLTNHVLQYDIEVFESTLGVEAFFPLIMKCENISSITITKGVQGYSIQTEVFAPTIKTIENVEIRVRSLSLNGEICDYVPFSGAVYGGTKLAKGVIISVHPTRISIPAASSKYFSIIITINETANCTHDDIVELVLYAEGDDGKSNEIILHVLVNVENEKSTSQQPFITQSTIILICGIFLIAFVSVKTSSALSNTFHPMYKLARMIFLLFPRIFGYLCPLATKYFEDDEARYNEYRDKICEILELKGERGATKVEIMKHLKKWLPYGTTGSANPEGNKVTGVVREHLSVLKKKKSIKQLGDRYYYRNYQPLFPEDVYTPNINWKSLLRDENFKLKGEVTCHIISKISSKGNEGIKNKELAEAVELTPYALHYHIKKLEHLKIIEKQKGRGKRYFLNTRTIQSHLSY